MIQQFRPDPIIDPDSIDNPELRMFSMYLLYKKEQKAKKYDDFLADLQRPHKQLEERRAAYERERQAPAMRQRHALALKMFR